MINNYDIKYIENIFIEGTNNILLNEDIEMETSDKGPQDLITKKDLLMEAFIINKLKLRFSNHKIIAEESINENLTDEYTWVIDPIDGTINFSNNSPLFGIQMALLYKKTAIFSTMYFPKFNEFHYALKDNGYFVNYKKYKLNTKKTLKNSIVSFGDFSNSNKSSRKHQLKLIEILNDECLKTRIQGASSIDFSFVASGKNQAHIIFSKNIWELEPGLLFIKEAGGQIYRYKGNKFQFEGEGIILCANSNIKKSIINILNTF